MRSIRSSVSTVGVLYASQEAPSSKESKLEPLATRQILMMTVVVFGVFIGSSIYSTLASFFPQSAFTKGLDSIGVGIIISVFPLTTTLLGGVAGYVIAKVGPRFVFLSGLFVASGASIPFAYVMMAEQGWSFYFSCIACRVFQGLGFLCVELSALSICVSDFKTRISMFVGLVEMSIGAGVSVGPAIGGIIFDVLGFEPPFLVIGGTGLVTFIIAYFTVHPTCEPDKDKVDGGLDDMELSIGKFLLMPAIYIPMMSALLVSIDMSYFDVSISPYVTETFDKSISEAGAIIFGYAGIYAILCPFIGAFTDKKGCHSVFLAAGCFVVGPAFLFIGPATFLNIAPKLYITVISFMVIGLGSSFMYVPAIELSFQIARSNGYKESVQLRGIITTVVLFSSNLGNLIGPILGGVLLEEIGFQNTGAVFSAVTLLVGCLSILYIVYTASCKNKLKNDFIDAERRHLLGDRIIDDDDDEIFIREAPTIDVVTSYLEDQTKDDKESKQLQVPTMDDKESKQLQVATTDDKEIQQVQVPATGVQKKDLLDEQIRLSNG